MGTQGWLRTMVDSIHVGLASLRRVTTGLATHSLISEEDDSTNPPGITNGQGLLGGEALHRDASEALRTRPL